MRKVLLLAAAALSMAATASAQKSILDVTTFSPEPGVVYSGGEEGLGTIIINNPGDRLELNMDCSDVITMTCDGSPVVSIAPADVVDGREELKHAFYLNIGSALQPGNYTLTIPNDFFTYRGAMTTGGSLDWELREAELTSWEVSPKETANISILNSVLLQFVYPSVELKATSKFGLTIYKDGEKFRSVALSEIGEDYQAGLISVVDYSNPIKEAGIYKFVLDAGSFKISVRPDDEEDPGTPDVPEPTVYATRADVVDPVDSPLVEWTYECTGFVEPKWEATPESGSNVASIEEIRIAFNKNIELTPSVEEVNMQTPDGYIKLEGSIEPNNSLGGNTLVLTAPEKLTSPGAYVVDWLIVAFEDGTSLGLNDYITVRYTIPEYSLYDNTNVTPAIGDVELGKASPAKITISSNGKMVLSLNPDATEALQLLQGGEEVALLEPADIEETADGFVIDFDYNDIELGTYSVRVPAGTFLLDGFTTKRYTYQYKVVEPTTPAEIKYTCEPAANSTVEELSQFVLTFAEANDVAIAANAEFKFTGAEGVTANAAVSGNKVTVSLSKTVVEDGIYTLSVGKGAIVVDGQEFEGCDIAVTVKAPVKPGELGNPTVSPAQGELKELGTITLTFAEDVVVESVAEPSLALLDEKEAAAIELGVSFGGNVVKLEAIQSRATELADGTYKLVVPAGFITTNKGANKADYTYTWTINTGMGVAAIFAGDGQVNVVNANGIVVLRNAKASELTTLAPGLYIINGKKVIIR